MLRALELDCEVLVKATKVDGVYDRDPMKHPDAVRYDTVTYAEALGKSLRIMDQSALALAGDEGLPIFVCKIEDLEKLALGKVRGTLVTKG